MHYFLIILCLISAAANAAPKNEIRFESGIKVSTCDKYNSLRETQRIAETTSNIMIASEYLECSLVPSLKPVQKSKDIILAVGKLLRIRSIPTSLGPRVDRKSVLGDKFIYDGNDSLVYSESEHNVTISLKGEVEPGSYLFWVVDEILDASYRAYYPVIIDLYDDEVKAKPFYHSGF